jgi:hypothetical protein
MVGAVRIFPQRRQRACRAACQAVKRTTPSKKASTPSWPEYRSRSRAASPC